MKAEMPKRIYLLDYNDAMITPIEGDTVYVREDAFIEKVAQFLYDYNQKQILKHGARATRGCGKYTINVYKFKKYMKGE